MNHDIDLIPYALQTKPGITQTLRRFDSVTLSPQVLMRTYEYNESIVDEQLTVYTRFVTRLS